MGSALSPAMLGRIENAVPRDRGVSPKEVADALGASLRSVRDGLLILWEDGRIGKIERRIGSHGSNLYIREPGNLVKWVHEEFSADARGSDPGHR